MNVIKPTFFAVAKLNE